MKIVQVKCPQCDQPIYQKRTDEMFLCQNCGALHHRDVTGSHLVPYEIAELNPQATGQRYYLPFWRLLCQVNIRSRNEVGGWTQKISRSIKGGDNGGTLYVFVPASDLDTATFRRLAVDLTMSPPRYKNGRTFWASSASRRPWTRERQRRWLTSWWSPWRRRNRARCSTSITSYRSRSPNSYTCPSSTRPVVLHWSCDQCP